MPQSRMPIAARARVGAVLIGLAATTAAWGAVAQAADLGATGATQTYVVLYRSGASTSGASSAVSSAGGTVVANYKQIGVVIARSDNTAFATSLQKKSGVEGVSATTGFGVQLKGEAADSVTADAPAPGSDGEPLSGLQWDMEQINAFAAHEITGGDPDVIVGDLDTGLDFTHPDLAPNYRADLSADCSSGAATPLLRGQRRERARNPHRRHHRRRGQRHRRDRRGPERRARRRQVEQRRRLLLPRDGDLLVHVGRREGHRRHQQQLLRRPVALQLRQRRRPAGDLEGGAPRDRGTPSRRGPWSSRPRATTAPTCRTPPSTRSARTSRPAASRSARSPTPARSSPWRCLVSSA